MLTNGIRGGIDLVGSTPDSTRRRRSRRRPRPLPEHRPRAGPRRHDSRSALDQQRSRPGTTGEPGSHAPSESCSSRPRSCTTRQASASREAPRCGCCSLPSGTTSSSSRDDFHGACHPAPPPRLARLDQLNRVIYLNGFSKSLSPRLPVGVVAGHRGLIEDLVDLKLLTHVATSEYSERLVHEVLGQEQYRKHRAKLLGNLQRARERALPRLQALGLQIRRRRHAWAVRVDGGARGGRHDPSGRGRVRA